MALDCHFAKFALYKLDRRSCGIMEKAKMLIIKKHYFH